MSRSSNRPFSSVRRRLLQAAPFLFLAGCDISPSGKAGDFLRSFQSVNDWIQEKMFSPSKLAPEYSDADATPESGFRVNDYDTDEPDIDIPNWKLSVTGIVYSPAAYTLDQIRSLPPKRMNTRHCCVEGWSMIPQWRGTPLSEFLKMVGADLSAKYLRVECGDDYYTSYDMASALHPQTLLCYEAYGKPLTLEHGAPIRIVMPTKLGYKSAKWISAIEVTNEKPGGYWEDQGYDWFAGL
ncbi:MAG TPA: molybdopterin-dependent oxidoreductase [Bacteroidota bacterium]|nr:molybdopterin-dependent oxidoreductase [Bacteroidota bacterium]